MKKIFIVLLCFVLMFTLALTVAAEGEIASLEETSADAAETSALEAEGTAEGEIEPGDSAFKIDTDMITSWVQNHIEEISVIITLIGTLIYQIRKHAVLNKSIAICNNNAVTVMENSNSMINEALSKVAGTADVVENYKNEIVSLLSEIRRNDADKRRLEEALTELENYLKTAKLANVELSNEVAELLVLANIPNSKKEELYSRHRKAVDALEAIELSTNCAEVKDNDGCEA